ncbi:MAG: O-antigen ligase family protein [Candidatus Omnitrophica bacterium]|nr:O-antigen ligase family protein [Candidatus Omnitrophota bacterium]
MDVLLINQAKKKNLYRIAIVLFILILFLQNAYIRVRADTADAPTVDWLVLLRVFAFSLAIVIGFLIYPQKVKLGYGAKILIVLALSAFLSSLFSKYATLSLGYSLLLIGGTALMIGLVYHAKDRSQLERIEKIWLCIIVFILLKDTITGLFFQDTITTNGGIQRAGFGLTHPNRMGTLAAIAFVIMPAPPKKQFYPIAVNVLIRLFLLYVLYSCISRVAIACFLTGVFFYYVFNKYQIEKRFLFVSSFTGFFLALFLFLNSFDVQLTENSIQYLKRNQSDIQLQTLTGRTVLWDLALEQAWENPIVGYGFGVTRFAINFKGYRGSLESHAHNDFIEVFLARGFLGLIPFLLMCIYSLKWATHTFPIRKILGLSLSSHAAAVVIMLVFVSSMFQIQLNSNAGAPLLLFFFYILCLDRYKQLSSLAKVPVQQLFQ